MCSHLILIAMSLVALASAFTPSIRPTITITRTVYVSRCENTTSTTPAQFPTETGTPNLELREIVVDQAGNSILATQYPIATTAWFPTKIGEVTTWIQVEYTQTFAAIPDQLPGPGVGTIGTVRPIIAQASGQASGPASGRTSGAVGCGDMRLSWWLRMLVAALVSLKVAL